MAKLDLVTTLRHLITNLDESIVIFDNEGTILHATASAEQLVDDTQLDQKSIFTYIEGNASGVRRWLQHLTESHFKDVSIKMLRKGESFPARLQMAAWRMTDGRFVVIASIVDSTYIERRKRDLLRKTLTIEQLSKSRKIRNGKLNDAIYEILEMCSKAVQVERVNAWLLDERATQLECIGNYDARTHTMVPQDSLPVIDMPKYFHLFETEKIILSADAQNAKMISELRDSYLIPNNIQAMMDIPLRIEGEIIGVICFEQVGVNREWSLQDQKFGLIAAQMVSLSVETSKRKKMQQELENALHWQQRLMTESNHRIKNNLSIMASLMRMQRDKSRDDFHRELLQSSINRIQSIASLHGLLAGTESSHRIQFDVYAGKIVNELSVSLSDPSKQIQLIASFASCEISASLAITLGLIINETVTNAYRHAFKQTNLGVIRVEFEQHGPTGKLFIADTGEGFPTTFGSDSQGMEIIKGLVDHIDGELKIDASAGLALTITFRLK